MALQILHNGAPLNGVLRIKADGTQKETIEIIKDGTPGQGNQIVTLDPDSIFKISAVEGNFDPLTGRFATVIGPSFEKGNANVIVNGKKSFTVRFY